MLSVRMFFSKKGSVRYISHLDISRAISRALARSGLDIVYTEGFNPHVRLVFIQPLSIFQESVYEAADFRLHSEDISFEEITTALNRVLPEGLEVMYTASPVMDISECAYATYSIKLDTDMSDDEVRDELSGEMVINKKTKSGYKDVDISEFVKSVSVKDGVVEMTVCAACNRCLNPALAIGYLGDKVRSHLITRTGLYNEKMEKFI
ncbi:MAG: DUF2344 domain-containing protein [Clostridia bacterium]|nr:DUF2344 domain-containing protein [Clostridia bacterium]